MKNKNKHKRDGRYIGESEAEYVVPDGRGLSVPLLLADSPHRVKGWAAPLTTDEIALLDAHRSGFRTVSHVGDDHQAKAGAEIARDGARSARDAWLKQISDAWRMDARKRKSDPDEDDPDDPDEDDTNDRSGSLMDIRRPAIRARASWVRSLSDQWRSPAPSPNFTTGLPTGPHGHPVRDSAAGPGPAQTLSPGGVPEPPDKEAMYAQRCRDLENAWRSPVGPGPAVAGASVSWKGPGA
jgi:hypothetical protein